MTVLVDAAVPTRKYHGAAVRLLAAAERRDLDGLYVPISIATCWHVAHEHEDTGPRGLFRLLADVMEAAPMNRSVLMTALPAPGTNDFEDAYLAAVGTAAGASVVATRNEPDFAETALTPHHPLDLLRKLTD